ncbi:hypothetical protein JCM17961_24910 [Endothiovibrio diazotrophicus]
MKRSGIQDVWDSRRESPDSAMLHPGYLLTRRLAKLAICGPYSRVKLGPSFEVTAWMSPRIAVVLEASASGVLVK